MELSSFEPVTFAVEGCCHGDLDEIYGVLEDAEAEKGIATDFLICCGDFQAVRTHQELDCMACPLKYRAMKDFVHYWDGSRKPYCPTLFIGGNHESPVHLRDLYYGGWASEDIYYLGHSGIVNIGGLRIAGLSGIYKQPDTYKGHYETYPYTEDSKRSAYHVRRFEVEKLLLTTEPIDVFISHDWPNGITNYGDVEKLLKVDKTGKLTADINSQTLGNPMTMEILTKLKPKYWFSGHMHMHFSAIVTHPDGSTTRFLALDKCQPRRQFLHFFKLNESGELSSETVYGDEKKLEYDRVHVNADIEWLAILKKNNHLIPLGQEETRHFKLEKPSAEDKEEIERLLRKDGKAIEDECGSFRVPYFGKSQPGNPNQRKWLCEVLGMEDVLGRDEKGDMLARGEEAVASMSVAISNDDGEDLFFLDSYAE
jgi:lariat debranching enzyme